MGWAPIVSAALSAASSFTQSQMRGGQQRMQASALEAQGDMLRKQAQLQMQKGEIEARAIDRQKLAIRREFERIQGRNRASLGAGYVDMTSGSPLEVSEGNITRFADDMGENAYAVALKKWETQQQVKALQFQAEQYDAQASYLNQTSGNLFGSLLQAGMAGMGSYAMMGGFNDYGSTSGVNESMQKGFVSVTSLEPGGYVGKNTFGLGTDPTRYNKYGNFIR